MRIPHYLFHILFTYFFFIVWQGIYRFVFYLINAGQSTTITNEDLLVSLFNRGVLFDLYITTIALVFPILIYWFTNIFSKRRIGERLFFVTALFLLEVIILFETLDIGYFDFYNSRLTSTVLIWFNSPVQLLKELFSNKLYLSLFVAFGVVGTGIGILYYYGFRRVQNLRHFNLNLINKVVLSLLILTSSFFGIRGSFDFEDTPLIGIDALHTDVPFANQLGVNPVFSFFDSFSEVKIDYTSNEAAVAFAQKELGVSASTKEKPVQRVISNNVFDSAISKPKNVVIILIESWSKICVNRLVNGKPMMPFLDNLIDKSTYFENAYSAGIHTHNGVFSTFYSMPSVLGNVTLSDIKTSNQKFDGLPIWLKNRGYENSFYTCGDKTFDNMAGFCQNNGFDRVYGEEDYSESHPRSSWGVYDFELLQEFSVGITKMKTPFFSSVLTINTHFGSGVTGMKPLPFKKGDPDPLTYGYADSSIAHFFESAKDQSWYENTLFVILGDHGQNFQPIYEVPLNYVNIPILFFDPMNEKGVVKSRPFSQIDVGPTIMSLLGGEYVNNTLGESGFGEPRPYAFFCADNSVGVVGEGHYLLVKDGFKNLYDLNEKSLTNKCETKQSKCKKMEEYGMSMLQATQYLIENQMTKAKE